MIRSNMYALHTFVKGSLRRATIILLISTVLFLTFSFHRKRVLASLTCDPWPSHEVPVYPGATPQAPPRYDSGEYVQYRAEGCDYLLTISASSSQVYNWYREQMTDLGWYECEENEQAPESISFSKKSGNKYPFSGIGVNTDPITGITTLAINYYLWDEPQCENPYLDCLDLTDYNFFYEGEKVTYGIIESRSDGLELLLCCTEEPFLPPQKVTWVDETLASLPCSFGSKSSLKFLILCHNENSSNDGIYRPAFEEIMLNINLIKEDAILKEIFTDSEETLFKAVLIHELTHSIQFYDEILDRKLSVKEALQSSQIKSWLEAADWESWYYQKDLGERPPVEYPGGTDPFEDMADSVMLYVMDPSQLMEKAPKRYAWIEENLFSDPPCEGSNSE